jgi:hypothetical protein
MSTITVPNHPSVVITSSVVASGATDLAGIAGAGVLSETVAASGAADLAGTGVLSEAVADFAAVADFVAVADFAGFADFAGAPPFTAVPQDVQNFTPSFKGSPQFEQLAMFFSFI